MLVISTAGTNTAFPFFELVQRLRKTLSGKIKNDSLFGIEYTIDDDDDWTDFKNWIKANPNYLVSITEDFLKQQLSTAIQNTSKQNIIKTKHLNVWSNVGTAWINPLDWEKCKDLDMQIEHFEGYPCYVGLVLASKKDIASRMRLFVKIPENSADGKPHYYLFSTHYTPSENIEGEDKAHYQGWYHDGYIVTHQGARIDIEEIQNDIKEDAKIFDLTGEDNEGGEVCGDPWNAQQLMTNLMSDGIVCVEIPQTVSSLSEPMKELEVLILEGRFHQDGNPVTAWMFQNVYCEPDHKDNIYPRKENKNSPNKIDGAVATINAMARAMYYNPEPEGNDGSLLLLDLDWS
jgi:phage terminase large subunit-like protein